MSKNSREENLKGLRLVSADEGTDWEADKRMGEEERMEGEVGAQNNEPGRLTTGSLFTLKSTCVISFFLSGRSLFSRVVHVQIIAIAQAALILL